MSLSISMILGLLAATLLLAQGVATLRQPNLPQPDAAQAAATAQQPKVPGADTWLGWLTILIAALGLLAQIMLYTGALVLTPRFGNVIVQGYPALVALNVLMVGISVSAGLWLSAVRMRVGWPQHKRLWVTLGLLFGVSTWLQILRLFDLLIGVSACLQTLRLFDLQCRSGIDLGAQALDALQMVPLNPSDPSPLHAFAYDLRWPPLLAWLAYCMIESLLALVLFFGKKNKDICNAQKYRDLRGWVGGLAIALQGVWALNQPVVSPRSVLLWKLIVLLAITYNTVKMFELVTRRVEISFTYWAAQIAMLKPAALWLRRKRLFVGLFAVLCFFGYMWLFSWIDTQPQWRAIVISIAIILLMSSWLPRRRGLWMRKKVAERWNAFVEGGAVEYRSTIPLLVLAASLLGLFYDFYGISIGIPLACFFMACVAFNDIAVERGLRYQLGIAARPSGKLYQQLHRRSALRVRLRRTGGGVGGIAKRLAAWCSKLLDLRTAALALVKLLIAIIVLLAVSEFVNAGKTIVQPFTISGLAESGSDPPSAADDPAGLAQAISDRLVGNLGGLGQMLQPDTIILSPGVRGGVKIQFVNAGPNAGSVDAVLAQNNELDIGGVKAPANLFVAPIRDPVRLALNVRTISGRIQDNGDSYTLLAISNKGETWISKYPRHDLSQAVISGTEELAFDILSSDPTFASFGMTRSWQAFQHFRDGLGDWEAFEQTQKKKQLRDAIDHFKEAIDADHSFALASYRLGIAQQQDGRPDSAIAAFRASIAADSKFVPAYNALAYTLYNFVEYDGNAKSAILPLVAPSGEQARADEARRHWQQIVLFPTDAVAPYERASAYYGLCLDAADQNLYQLAYFYCQRAESMYGQLSSSLRADLRVKQAEAAVLNTLGVAVMRLRLPQVSASQLNSVPEVAHSCLAVELNDTHVAPPPSLTAQRYFEQALSLQPDDPNIRCNLAGADFVSGNRERAQALDADAGTLRSLSESYRILAKKYFFLSLASDDLAQAADQDDIEERYRKNAEAQRASALTYYRMALEGYQRVLDHDPLDQQALLGYAYTIWQWRFEQLHTLPIEGPLPAEAHNGLSYARRAAELADASPSSPIKGLAHARFGAVLLGQLEVPYAIRELEIALSLIEQEQEKIDPSAEQNKAAAANLPPIEKEKIDPANDETIVMLADETRWMLAQAYLCQGGHNDRASKLLDEIASGEAARDSKPFTESRFLDTLLPGSNAQYQLLRCTLDGA